MIVDTGRKKKALKYSAIATAVVLVMGFMIAQPAILGPVKTVVAQEVEAKGVEPYQNCKVSTTLTPEDPIDMNTVRVSPIGVLSGQIIKTVHKEKQIYECELVQNAVPVIVEVMIVAEIFEDLDRFFVDNKRPAFKKIVEVTECQKVVSTGSVLGCNSYKPKRTLPVVSDCIPQELEHPQEMNTVIAADIQTSPTFFVKAKTVIANKEVFQCNNDTKKKDVVIFAEIIEDLLELFGPENTVKKKFFESLTCIVNKDTAFVEGCKFKRIPKTLEPVRNCAVSSTLTPEDPVDMNTVSTVPRGSGVVFFVDEIDGFDAFGEVIKTVHKDKEIFECELVQNGIPIIVEVMIVAEIFENVDKLLFKENPIIRKQVEVIQCQKLIIDGSVLGCNSYKPKKTLPVVSDCIPQELEHPQEMNTDTGLVTLFFQEPFSFAGLDVVAKTIIANKEVFQCNNDTKKKDVVIFSEIIEHLDRLAEKKNPVVAEKHLSLTCVVIKDTAFVEGCRYKNQGGFTKGIDFTDIEVASLGTDNLPDLKPVRPP